MSRATRDTAVHQRSRGLDWRRSNACKSSDLDLARLRRLRIESLEDRRLLAVGDLLQTLNDPGTAPQASSYFGQAVATNGSLTVVGTPSADLQGYTDVGAVYIFDSTTGALLWTLANPTPAAYDYFGFSVAISGNMVVVGAYYDDTGAGNSGSAYVFDANTGTLLRTLANPTPAVDDNFGYSVAISGSTVVVGAYRDDTGVSNAGSAYVFSATTGALLWTLANPTPAASDYFGYSVAISGSTVVVGATNDSPSGTAAGSAYVFNATTGALLWTLANPTPAGNDVFGYSVAISGSTVVVGAYADDTGAANAGSVYVFDATTGALVWTINNPTPAVSDNFGYSVAISGSTVVVGAYQDDTGAANAGSVYVFDATTGTLLWTLANPTPAASDLFGYSVAISGSTVVVGAYFDNTSGTNAGSAYVFDAGTGTLLRTLVKPVPAANDWFGNSVAISGSTVVVGAPLADRSDWGATDAGLAYVFDAGTGTLVRTLAKSVPNTNDQFGNSVAISGSTVVVGAYLDDPVTTNVGAAYVFDSNTGTLLSTLANPTPASGDLFGNSVAISGSTVVVGAPYDYTVTQAGAAYLFDAGTGALMITLNNPTPALSDQFGNSVAIWGRTAVIGVPYKDGSTIDRGAAYVYEAANADIFASLTGNDLFVEEFGEAERAGNTTLSLNTAPTPDVLVLYDATGIFRTGIAGASGSGTHTLSIPITAFSRQMLINAYGNDDTLTVDFSGGNPIPAAGLVYDGGANGATGDTLHLVGTATEGVVYAPDGTTSGKGTVSVAGATGTISFVNLESASISNVQSIALVTPNANDNLTLSPDTIGGVSATKISGTSGGVGMAALSVSDVGSLVLDLGADPPQADADYVSLTGAQMARGLNSIAIALGGGANQVEVPGTVNLGPSGQFLVTGDPATLTLSGGSIAVATLQVPAGSKVMGTGTLSEAAVGGATRIEATGPLSLGTGGTSGFNFDGTLVVGSNTVTLNSTNLAKLGTLTTLNGGTINAANGISIIGGVLQGSGTVNGRVSASFGSTIEATGDLVLGDSNSYAGFAGDGELYTGSHTVTLRDRDVALLGTLTVLGSAGSPGSLIVSNSLTVDSGHTLAGYGTVNTPNLAPKALVNNGNIVGDSIGQPITLSGYIKGVGTFDFVQFTGTYSPGLSPVQQQVGSVALAENSTLLVELGGTQPGSQYDQLVASGTLQLDGTLQVSLINGFTPTLGDHFAIVSPAGGAVTGSFDKIVLPALPVNCTWDVGYSPDAVGLTATAMKLDGDGNSSADALSDGILMLRYLFDPTGAWNVNDALGSGATRGTRPQIKAFLDGGRTGVLDADGNGTADALSDGILILRYLFDPTGAWNVADALGSGATRTTREAIKAYLDGFNPGVSPPPGLMAGGATEEPGTESLIAAVAPAVLMGSPGTVPAADANGRTFDATTSGSNDATSPAVVGAVDAALAQWDSPVTSEDGIDRLDTLVSSGRPNDDGAEPVDQLWGGGGMDWFLVNEAELPADQQTGERITAL